MIAILRTALFIGMVVACLGVAPVRAQSRAIEQVSSKVVKIFGSGGFKNLYAYSSGFLVRPNGYIVTVWNHVLDEPTVKVVLDDGRQFTGRVVGAEPPLDLALIKIDAEDLPYFNLDDAVSASPGTRILAFSNMFKVASGDEPVSVLHGVIGSRTKLTARRGNFDVPYHGPVYVVDAITNNPGSGGGVLTTRDGTLLAMIGKELKNSQTNTWINYAIPISELKTSINDIIEGRVTRKPETDPDADLAGRYSPLDFGIVMIPDVVTRTPAFVDRVLPGTLAAAAGLKPDDLILFVNEDLVQSCRSLDELLGKLEAGDTLRIVLRRGVGLVSVELPIPRKVETPKP